MLTSRHRRNDARLLEQFWSMLRRNRSALPPAGLEPAVADFVAWLDQSARPPEPRAAFDEQLWRRLAEPGATADQRAWSGPAVDPAQRRRTARVVKESEEQVVVSDIADVGGVPTTIRPHHWAREGLKIAAAVAVFVVVGMLLILVLRDNARHPQVVEPGPTPTPGASPTTLSSPSPETTTVRSLSLTPTADALDLTVTAVWGKATAEAAATGTTVVNTPIGPGVGDIGDIIKVGSHPMGAAVAAGSLWVANGGSGTVSRIDMATDQVVATIEIGPGSPDTPSPDAVVILGDQIWVSNAAQPSLVRIDPATNQAVQTIAIPDAAPYVWRGVAARAGSIWLSDPNGNRVIRVDPQSGSVVATIEVGGAAGILALDDAVWVSDWYANRNRVVRIDPATNQVVDTVGVGDLAGPWGIAAGFGSIWVACQTSGVVQRIDPGTDEIIATVSTFSLNGRSVVPDPQTIEVDENGVWVGDPNGGVYLIDPVTNTVTASAVTPGIDGILASDGSIWVSLFAANEVVRINPAS